MSNNWAIDYRDAYLHGGILSIGNTMSLKGKFPHSLCIAGLENGGEQSLVVSHGQKIISTSPLVAISTDALNEADTLMSLKGTSNQLNILVFKIHS